MRGNPSNSKVASCLERDLEDTELVGIERAERSMPFLRKTIVCRLRRVRFAWAVRSPPRSAEIGRYANCNGLFLITPPVGGRTVPVKSLPVMMRYLIGNARRSERQDWWQEDLGCDAALNRPQGRESSGARGGGTLLGFSAQGGALGPPLGRFPQWPTSYPDTLIEPCSGDRSS